MYENSRLLADIANIVNSGVGFTAVVLPDGTIKLYLNTGVSLSDVKYSVTFTDPSKIITTSGATLQNMQSLISIQQSAVYPASSTY